MSDLTPKLTAKTVVKYKTPNSDAVHLSTKHQMVTNTPSRHGQIMLKASQQMRS